MPNAQGSPDSRSFSARVLLSGAFGSFDQFFFKVHSDLFSLTIDAYFTAEYFDQNVLYYSLRRQTVLLNRPDFF